MTEVVSVHLQFAEALKGQDLAETGNSRRRGVGLFCQSRNGVMNNFLLMLENVICNLTVFF